MDKIKETIKKITEHPLFKKLWLPGSVVLIGLILLIIAPWTGSDIDDPTIEPTATIEATEEPPPPETPFDDPEDYEEVDTLPTSPPDGIDPGSSLFNPLTGEPWIQDMSGIRPWAITIDNHIDARPQLGIGKADIICEFDVEGSTRFIAIFQDISTVGTVGGIRSLRSSSMEIAGGFDAIFTHWAGLSYEGTVAYGNPMTRWGTMDASGRNTDGKQVGFRYSGKKSPHNAMTTGENLLSSVPDGYRTEHEGGFDQTFKFKEDGTPSGNNSAKKVTVNYHNRKTSIFTYDSNAKTYTMRQSNKDLIDGLDDRVLAFTNVIIIRTSVRIHSNGTHRQIGTTGEGEGYFICGGKYAEITWKRENLDAPYSFYLKNGTPLEMGVGKSFICFTPNSAEHIFE